MSALNTRTISLEDIQTAVRDASYHEILPDKTGPGGFSITFAKRKSMETFFDAVTELAGILQREKSGLS